jgi:hypothetical protein
MLAEALAGGWEPPAYAHDLPEAGGVIAQLLG